MKRLIRFRARIDVIDAEILRLLSRRAKIAIEVGRLKRSSGLPYYSPVREREILARLTQLNPGPLKNQGIKRMFRVVIRESLKVEKKGAAVTGRE